MKKMTTLRRSALGMTVALVVCAQPALTQTTTTPNPIGSNLTVGVYNLNPFDPSDGFKKIHLLNNSFRDSICVGAFGTSPTTGGLVGNFQNFMLSPRASQSFSPSDLSLKLGITQPYQPTFFEYPTRNELTSTIPTCSGPAYFLSHIDDNFRWTVKGRDLSVYEEFYPLGFTQPSSGKFAIPRSKSSSLDILDYTEKGGGETALATFLGLCALSGLYWRRKKRTDEPQRDIPRM
jgi:hypothetical protein